MAKHLRALSGRDVIKILSKMGFEPKRQRGSHIILIKATENGKIGCVVPLHHELKIGTLKGILEQAGGSKLDQEQKASGEYYYQS